VDQRFGDAELDWVRHHVGLRRRDIQLSLAILVPPGYENGGGKDGEVPIYHLHRPLTRRGVAGVLQEVRGDPITREPASEEEPRAQIDLTGLRILVVEDQDQNRQYLTRVLEDAGAALDEASDGEIGLAQFLNGSYDLVLTDLDMPGMDGFQLLEGIRKIEPDHRTPVVAVTAHTDPATTDRCFRAGMDAFVTKPVGRMDLLQAVRDLTRPTPQVLVVEDDPHSLEVTCQILQREGYRSQAAATGQEALDLVAEGGIDAVLLDMSLPDISGLEVVKEIRKKPGRDLLPVIGVTGHAGSDQAALCREAGCSAFVEKPVKWKALLGQLADLLSSEGPVFTPLVDGLAHLESKPVGERGPESGVEEEAPSKDSDTAAA